MPDYQTAAEVAKSTPRDIKRIQTQERWRELIEMRKQGIDYWTIADTLGFATAQGAQSALIRALRYFGSLAADDLRYLEASKLDDMERTYYPAAVAGDKDAFDRWIKIHDARAKLFGLQLQRQEVTHKGQPQNQTMVVIGGDGQAYLRSLEEVAKLRDGSADPPIDAEVVGETADLPMFADG